MLNRSPAFVDCVTEPGDPWVSALECPYNDALAVFRFRLSHDPAAETFLRALLQPDERDRAQRYRRTEDQRRFAQARGWLRLLAGRYLNQHPATVRFRAGVNKKPELANAPGRHMNVSHSDEWVLLAFSRLPVGVDVEHVKSFDSIADLLPVSFSPPEQAYVLDQADRQQAFYVLWTRKEALAKATAKGIDDDFSRLPCLDGAHRPVGLDGLGTWRVVSVGLADAYSAALACQIPDWPKVVPLPHFYTLDGELLNTERWFPKRT